MKAIEVSIRASNQVSDKHNIIHTLTVTTILSEYAYPTISIQYPLALTPLLALEENMAIICGNFMQRLRLITE